MPSSTEQDTQIPTRSGCGWTLAVNRWNTRLHYFLGLYLLLFVWLFAFTGLLLNHSSWKFAEFWDSRKQSAMGQDIVPPSVKGDLARAHDLMEQLGIRGEIEWTTSPGDSSRLDFRVSRRGHIFEIKTDFVRKKATVQRIDLNAWGILRILHTFTGVRLDDPRNQRDWAFTSAWALAMDAVAIGLILMILSSLWIWYETRRHRVLGGIVLLAGCLACGLFCVGLNWLF
jgi:hypothetical protein